MTPQSNGMFSGAVAKALRSLPAGRASTVGSQLKQAATLMHSKIGNLHVQTIKGHADTQHAVECFNPKLLGTARMLSHAQLSKHVPQISRAEWEQYVVMPPPTPLPTTTSARVAWWAARSAALPALSSIAAFFVRRPRSACHVERTFSLLGHIQTPDRRNMSNETLRHLAVLYVNKPNSKCPSGDDA